MNGNIKSEYYIFAELIALCGEKKALKKAVLSKPYDKCIIKTVITRKVIGKTQMLQCEKFMTDNKAYHQNIPLSDIDSLASLINEFAQINLISTVGDAELKCSKNGKITLINDKKLTAKLNQGSVEATDDKGNDEEKAYILTGNESFLKLLGVSDQNGRVYDKKRSKFRQINRFLEHIRDIVKYLPESDPLYVCDLCCGKSYLSFAAYYYFKYVLGRNIIMTGVDLKKDVISYCNDVSSLLGFDTLKFISGDITKYETENKPSLVISLHACDTATDIVLAKAMEWEAKVILSTPCCHHELNHKISCGPLKFVTDHSMLRQKLCDAATDGLRLKLLEANGYRTDALELIDPEDTPKNIMLRAVKSFSGSSKKALDAMHEYKEARKFLLGENE